MDEREITDPKDVKVTFDNNGDALYFSRATIPYARDGGTGHAIYKHLAFMPIHENFWSAFGSYRREGWKRSRNSSSCGPWSTVIVSAWW
ncbi:cytidylyltransferase domain-containing protein [Desulfosarcina cetonica]|uniref:cytidylyltransferase domain-containing protein n=1 Tax=Desulfosarcina cetonica TaxID=90730 RepID=UPI00278C0371|nr:hypothetical protein [Desulfosarcina cetonica]